MEICPITNPLNIIRRPKHLRVVLRWPVEEYIPVQTTKGGIDVEVIPEPSSAILFLSVFAAGIFGAGRRGSRLAAAQTN